MDTQLNSLYGPTAFSVLFQPVQNLDDFSSLHRYFSVLQLVNRESKPKENGSSELSMWISVWMCSTLTIDARTSADTYMVMSHNRSAKGRDLDGERKKRDGTSFGFTAWWLWAGSLSRPEASLDCFLSHMYTLSSCLHISRLHWYFLASLLIAAESTLCGYLSIVCLSVFFSSQ